MLYFSQKKKKLKGLEQKLQSQTFYHHMHIHFNPTNLYYIFNLKPSSLHNFSSWRSCHQKIKDKNHLFHCEISTLLLWFYLLFISRYKLSLSTLKLFLPVHTRNKNYTNNEQHTLHNTKCNPFDNTKFVFFICLETLLKWKKRRNIPLRLLGDWVVGTILHN